MARGSTASLDTKLGDGSFSNPTRYASLPGNLRIWTVDGTSPRDPRDIDAGGNFVRHEYVRGGKKDDWARIGITETTRSATLWVEGIRASDSLGDLTISFVVDIDGFGSAFMTAADEVRVTAVEVNLVSNQRKRGGLYTRLSSVVGAYQNPVVPFDLGIETIPDLSSVPQAGAAVWDLQNGNSTTVTTAIAPGVATLSRSAYGERAARVRIPVLNAEREVILNVPNLGGTSETAAVLSLGMSYSLAGLYLNMTHFKFDAAVFAYEDGHPSDQTLNSAGYLDAINNSVGNALKHAYFAARFALEYSPADATYVTTAHEYDGMVATPQYDPTEAVMDKFNNIVGINIAKAIANAGVPEEMWESEIKDRLRTIRDANGLWVVQSANRIVKWNDWKDIRDTQW